MKFDWWKRQAERGDNPQVLVMGNIKSGAAHSGGSCSRRLCFNRITVCLLVLTHITLSMIADRTVAVVSAL